MIIAKRIIQAFLLIGPIFIIAAICLAESIQDGAIFREEGDVYLKNGEVVECKRFWWFVRTADFIQCDKGDRADKIMVRDIDIEKTFGDTIAKEYAVFKGELDERHAEREEEREANITVISPSGTTGEESPGEEELSAGDESSAEEESPAEMKGTSEEREDTEESSKVQEVPKAPETEKKSTPVQETISGTTGEASGVQTKKDGEKELTDLKSRIEAIQKQIESAEKIIDEARPRLEKLPGYSETLKKQVELMAQRAKAKDQGKPTDTLTAGIIEAGKELEKIMRKDAEVSKAMNELIKLSAEETDIKAKIERLEKQMGKSQESADTEKSK